jgi:hypothetical protein
VLDLFQSDICGLGDQWPELLGVLFQASQSPDSGLREAAFRIFNTTPGIIEKPHEEAVVGVFSKGFKDDVVSVCHRSHPPGLRPPAVC